MRFGFGFYFSICDKLGIARWITDRFFLANLLRRGFSKLIARCSGLLLFLIIKQIEHLRTHHASHHGNRQRTGYRVIINVDVQPIHHIEVRIGKEFFHRRIANLRGNTPGHKRLEVRLGGQFQRILQ